MTLIDDDFRFGKNDALSYTNAGRLSMLSVDETLSYGQVSRLKNPLLLSSSETGHFQGGVKLPPRRYAPLR